MHETIVKPRRQTLTALALLAGAMVFGTALANDATRAPEGAACSGTIRDAKGKPIAGVAVSVEGGGSAKTAADGTYAISSVPPGDALVTAEIRGRFRVRTLLHVAAGEARRWDATIGSPGHLRGLVVDEYGHPLTRPPGAERNRGWHVLARPEQEWMHRPDSEKWDALTDANGAFDLRVSPDALFRLRVRRLDSWARAVLTEPMSAGLADITLRVLPADTPHARVRCRLEESDGTSLTGVAVAQQVHLVQDDGDFAGFLSFDAAKREWISARVAPGSYAVVAPHPRLGTFEFPVVRIRDAADVDVGTLRFPPPGRVRLAPARSGPGSDAVVRVHAGRFLSFENLDGRHGIMGGRACPEFHGDAVVEVDLFPGRYRTGIGHLPPFRPVENVEIPFEVRSGETTDVTVPLRGAPLRALHLRYPGKCPSQAMVTASDVGGIVEGRGFTYSPDEQDLSMCLAPGRHALVVVTSDRRRLTATLDIPAENAPERFDVVLR